MTECRPEKPSARARRRIVGFRRHILGYFGIMLILVPANLLTQPEWPWFLLPMVGWGAILALHAAWAMGLMDGLFGDRNESERDGRTDD